jgi:1-acyl-sn-glycerol-3-phosphate acyltransferase
MPATRAPLPIGYRLVVGVSTPFMLWSRIRVTGTEDLPTHGPTLLVANHDSNWDPVTLAYAARHRRQLRALAKAELWKNPLVAKVLDNMGQIPIERGRNNVAAMAAAEQVLRDGGCIGVFPEGTRSRGKVLKARSGAGRLVRAVPDTVIVCARVTGTAGPVWRPGGTRLAVHFFRPAGGQRKPDEPSAALMIRLLAEIRAEAPPVGH